VKSRQDAPEAAVKGTWGYELLFFIRQDFVRNDLEYLGSVIVAVALRDG
jgi:hypothetical protein